MDKAIADALDKSKLVFVYGTLKKGYGNNSCLAQSMFLGEAVSVAPAFRLYEGGVPFLTDAPENGTKVKGELYSVSFSDFARCDRLEGHPNAYRRELREFVLTKPSGEHSVMAWVYLWPSRQRGMCEVQAVKGVAEWRRQGSFSTFVMDEDGGEE